VRLLDFNGKYGIKDDHIRPILGNRMDGRTRGSKENFVAVLFQRPTADTVFSWIVGYQ
jgi:hypothetical protein